MDPSAETAEKQQPTQADRDDESVHAEESNEPPPVAGPDPPPPPQQDTVPTPNLQYGSGPYTSVGTGWSAMARIVHEVDAQKVQDYKEDIDTILVFAGLFSASMTAFLVESYQNLRQDPTDLIIFLMQQVTTQTHSYVLTGTTLNSTAPPLSQLPTFTPSVNAIRVNVLWFASLTLSLASASFAILVKQWLREYLAGDYTSPQARLRIRHFRNPGLAHWNVFEIAAVLPLLLQLSLALFLIGLCFFTSEVHSAIGHTTIPLVAGWAFLFIASSFAPAISPRCPYKTTLLKSVMKVARKQLFRIVQWVLDSLQYAQEMPKSLTATWSYKNLAYDEEDAVITDYNDIDILVAVDSIQSDEQLLIIMWDALQQSQPDPADSVTFVQKLISNRIQRNIATNPPSSFLDLKPLPKQTATSIMLMVAEILRNEINRQSPTNITKVIEWSEWMKDCVYILFSETNAPTPALVNQVFALLLADQLRYKPFFEIIRSRVPDSETFSHLLERLRGAIFLVKGESMLPILLTLMHGYFGAENSPEPGRLIDLIREHPEIPSHHLQRLVDILIQTVTNEMKPDMYWWSYLVDQLDLILELSSNASWRDTVVKLVQTMLIQPKNTAIYCRSPMGLNEQNSKGKEEAQDLFIDAILASNASERRTIMWNFESSLAWQWRSHLEADDNSWDRWLRMDPLEACRTLLRLLKAMKDRGLPIDEYSYLLSRVWWDVDDGLRLVASRHYDGHPDLAKNCLLLVDALDISSPLTGQDEDAFATWSNEFPESESWFPDTFISALAQFLPPNEVTVSHRLRRLRYLERRNENTARHTCSGSRRSSRSKSSRRSRKSSLRVSIDSARLSNPEVEKDDATSTTSSHHDTFTSNDERQHRSDHDANADTRTSDDLVIAVNEGSNHGGDSDTDDSTDEVLLPSPTDTANPNHDIASPLNSPRIRSPEVDPDKPPDTD